MHQLLRIACVVPAVLMAASRCEAQDENWGPLVSAKQLQRLLKSETDVRLVEVGQDREGYRKGHLPNAVFIDWVDDIIDPQRPERYNVVSKSEMESLLSRLGVTRTTHVVLYDDLSSRLSTRMYWSLKHYGHDRVHVLDGGRAAWIAAGNPMSRDTVVVPRTTYEINRVNEKYRVTMAYIHSHLDHPDVQLVDGRPPDQYSGEDVGRVFHTGKPHKNRGHIPGAVNIFWKDNFNEDGTFRSTASLRELYRQRGIRPETTIVTYCNEGLHAAPPWFVLKELLGYEDVRVYDDSMSEWANESMPTKSK